jgi:O-antigen ligase
MLTNTRAAIILAAIMLALCVARGLIVLSPGRWIAGACVAAASLFFVPEDVWVRVLDVTRYAAGQNTGTLELRAQFWDAALRGIERHPWVGNGIGNQTIVPALTLGISPKRISAHNEYLNTMLEVGIIGWVLMFGAILLLVRSSFRAARIFRTVPGRAEQYWFMVACQLTLISALLYGLQVDVFHFPLKGFWLVAGLSWSMEILAREEARTHSSRRKANQAAAAEAETRAGPTTGEINGRSA